MRTYLLHLSAAILLLAAASAHSAVINQTAATIVYDDTQTFGSFASSFENPSSGSYFASLSFNPIPNLQASAGQNTSATSSISLTITAAPGYELTDAFLYENGGWATEKSGSVDVTAQGGIVDSATGLPLGFGPPFAEKQSVVGDTLSGGEWFVSESFTTGFLGSPSSGVTAVTVQLSRTLSASGGVAGDALIGNLTSLFGGSSGLTMNYTARLVPEPETYAMFSLGLIMLSAMIRRMQS
jgi:hypothetical protein